MIKFPYIFTFYSYKGGVGRSMALLNTAYTLAARGRHVLILDMDLEAPGLSDFLNRNHEYVESSTQDAQDIVELLSQVKEAAQDRIPPDQALLKLSPIEHFRRHIDPSKVQAPRIGLKGHLDVLPAIMDETYWTRWADLALTGTSKDDLQRMGLILAAYLQQQRLTVSPPGLDELGETESVPYDYILVDSRTGITELGGLCVGHLCDRLVVCTALNDQNIHGTESFLQEAGIELKVRSTENFEPWDAADPKPGEEMTPETIGPKPTLIVATPVPYGEIGYKRERVKALREAFGPVSAKLSYHPQMALMESIFVRDYPEEYLTAEYQGLTDRLMASVSDHYVQLSSRSVSAWSERNDPEEAVDAAIRAAGHNASAGISLLTQWGNQIPREEEKECKAAIKLYGSLARLGGEIGHIAFFKWGGALSFQAKILKGEASESLFTQAYEKYAKAVAIKADSHIAWNNWANALSDQAGIATGEASEHLFTEAYEKYATAVATKPDYHEPWSNWGAALLAQAMILKGDASESLFTEAYEKCAKAVAIKPDFHEALLNWGNVLLAQAQILEDKASETLFTEAYEKYAKAVAIKADSYDAWNNWGTALANQAKILKGKASESLFTEAYKKYSKAVTLKPDPYSAWNNWGAALSSQAQILQGKVIEPLFSQAYDKYAEAVGLKPDYYDAWNNWGTALRTQAVTLKGDGVEVLFSQACEKYAKAVSIKPDKHEAWNDWGTALLAQAQLMKGTEAEELFRESRQKYDKALELHPGDERALFNLACLEALCQRPKESVTFLNQMSISPKKLHQKIMDDSDFDPIRQDAHFQDFLKTLSQ